MKFLLVCCIFLFLDASVCSADGGVSVALDEEIGQHFQNDSPATEISGGSKTPTKDTVADEEIDKLFQIDQPTTEMIDTTTKAAGGIVKFFKSFKDSVKNAGSHIHGGLKDLHESVSARFASTTSTTTTTTSSSTTSSTTSSSAIVFPTEEGVPLGNGTMDGELDDRFLIDAPQKCQDGYRLAGSNCRKIA